MDASANFVSFVQVGNVGVITIENPPVNALNRGVNVGLLELLRQTRKNTNIHVLLLRAAGNLFSAGADLREFDSLSKEPTLQQVQAALEAARLPVVAAIQGLALGGGLELAMACHYRVAHKDARLGLPEITLGIVPGAGGTQRLPRLIGARLALDMILSGTPITAADAKAKGLVDEIATGDLRASALAFCNHLVQDGLGPRPTCNRTVSGGGLGDSDIAEALRAHARTLKGRTTHSMVVEAIQASILPFTKGAAVEAALSKKSLASRESQALRHVFLAERASDKLEGIPKHPAKAEINRVAVVGAGTMGTGIAIAFADAGRKVILIDNADHAIVRSREAIRAAYDSSVMRGRITREIADARAAAITGSTTLAEAAEADLVIEAVFEDMDLKKQVLSSLDSVVPAGHLIASNTSTLSVTELGRVTKQPARVLGMHFFVPAHASKLLEIVRGSDTAPEALATALFVAKLLRKVPVVTGDRFGFIGNRMMLDGYFREAEQLLLEGASPLQVDTALEQFGFSMGPQRVSDLGGNDVGTKVRQQLYKRESRPDPYFVIADRLTQLGRLGQKTGRGFYRYENAGREALPDPEVTALIETLSAERGIERRRIDNEEIVERCILALINVGAMVLYEGVAARPAAIDVVWTSGYGFPRHLGGPMFYADTLGLQHVADRIRYYHERLGHYWRPAQLLLRLAEENSSFEEWGQKPGTALTKA